LPLNKVRSDLFREAARRSWTPDPESKRFAKRIQGILWDIRHALAAGVTDVFTSDGPMDELLADFRTTEACPADQLQRCGGMAPFVRTASPVRVKPAPRSFPAASSR